MRELNFRQHRVADIHGVINAAMREDSIVLRMFDYRTFEEALKYLRAMIQDGLMVIPNDRCDNQAYDGHCLGHQTWSEPGYGGVTLQEAADGIQQMNELMNGVEFMR